jgi:hypothetical protein
MKYNFSAQFLKVIPPNTSFGDTWDAFCLSLLQQEDGHQHYLSLKAPDRGVDILNRIDNTAIQCKSDERGALGTISPTNSIESLKTAVQHKGSIGWVKYSFATNANYSGDGVEKIFAVATTHGLNKGDIEFLGPEYWSSLCEKHLDTVKHFLDYRLTYTEAEVEEAFRKARYYDEYVKKYVALIKEDCITIEVANNKIPIVLSIPFSKELTIEQCLNVAKSLLGLSLNTEHYSDIGTSAKPSLSLTLDQKAQPFKKKLGEFSESELKRLKLWIKIVYSFDEDSKDSDKVMYEMMYKTTSKISGNEAKNKTIERFNRSIEDKMWSSIIT